MVNYESSFSNISSRSIEEGNYLEKKILQRNLSKTENYLNYINNNRKVEKF